MHNFLINGRFLRFGKHLQILSSTHRAVSVKPALEKVVAELNEKLAKIPGYITKMDADVSAGVAGASVRVVVVVDESDIRPKYIIWANEVGGDEGSALRRAEEKVNAQLNKLRGEVAGFHLQSIAPPLVRRTYVTLIVAVNEKIPAKVGRLTADERRERLAAAIQMLGNDPNAVNLSHIAKIFDVSRDVIYEDLKKLGIKR
jgi:hypothetical protein